MTNVTTDAREAAWAEFRDSPDYAPTDRYPIRDVFDAAWRLRGEADAEAVAIVTFPHSTLYTDTEAAIRALDADI